jgi:hypothetical protein
VGLIQSYFLSDKFLEGEHLDFLGLRAIYGAATNRAPTSLLPYGDAEIRQMHQSLWYNYEIQRRGIYEAMIDKVEEYALNYVKANRHLIGRVADETFLKLMALDVAMYYNRVFGVDSMQAFELYHLHPEDLLRVSIARQHVVMEGAPYSFSRFVYSIAGQGGVYAAAILLIVIYIGNFIKPILVITIFLVVFVSLFVWKLILKAEEQSLQGYIFLTGAVGLLNVAYALMLKLTMFLPSVGFSPFICMLLSALMQLFFIALYFSLTTFVIKNWKDLGAVRFKEIFAEGASKVKLDGLSKVLTEEKPKDGTDKSNAGWEAYNKYKASDANRAGQTGGTIERKDPFGRRNNNNRQ